MKKTLVKSGMVVALVLGFAAGASANTILIDNLGQPPEGLWNIGSEIGQAFTTGSAVDIKSATFRHDFGGYVPSPNAYLTIQDTDGVGKIGPTILDTWTSFSDAGNLVTFWGCLALGADTTYWLVLHDTSVQVARVSSTTAYTANFGATLPDVYNNYESSTGNYYSLSDKPLMFQVTVPEGGLTVVLLGMGILALGYVRGMVK
jgi:hypothetical protein